MADEYRLYNTVVKFVDVNHPDAEGEEREALIRRYCNSFLNF